MIIDYVTIINTSKWLLDLVIAYELAYSKILMETSAWTVNGTSGSPEGELAQHPFNYILTTRYKVRVIKDLLESVQKGSLLDVGCGSGFLLSKLEHLFERSTGID